MSENNINNTFFQKVKQLFSTDVIIRNVGGNQLKVLDTSRIQQLGSIQTNSLYDRFNKIYTTTGRNSYNNINQFPTSRIQLYTDYEAMDTDSIICSTLDIIADEVSLRDDFGDVLQIRSSDETIQKILHNLFYDILNIEFNLWSWTRNMCKYGDFYLKLEISENFGIYNVIPFSSYTMIRVEGENPENPTEVKFKYDPTYTSQQTPLGHQSLITNIVSEEQTFDNYEIAHFRLLSDYNYLPYGRSYLEPARKIFKQLQLMEDAMLIHRIVRAPEKRTFFVNVGNIPPNEVEQYMKKTIDKMKKTPYMDPQTGDYNLKYNVQNILEDFYIPVRGNDTSTKIETTQGLTFNAIEDIEYLRDKLFAALKVPKAYFGYEKDLSGKSTLAAEDIRFARTVERIQRIIISELTKIALVHLYSQGYEGESLTNFELSLTTPSIIYDQERIALLKEKTDLAVTLKENKLLPSDWIYDNIFRFSQNQYDEYRDMIIEDVKRDFRLTQIENEGNDPLESGEIYGTPSILQQAASQNRYGSSTDVPDGYDEKNTTLPSARLDSNQHEPLGRPKEKTSIYNTQDSGLGKDRLGSYQMKKDNTDSDDINPPTKKGALRLENTKAIYHTMKSSFPSRKQKLFESSNLLDEENILNEDDID
jgi:hypothetical protein